ncbi:maleylacetoacetate isomerase [Allopusillimonas ginsengisoli]|uniref:maleylacetoacetate isomerase n=1 Tax=Allopusillimonas ginsengisoli TaxID=453575 RepID=UPI00101ED320|nr:maleylacetoacetate isomerase [Allopusillimonas ginsengisoli]TEA79514.1 maleylacetoacetate isomerase [Allopusillimonas ginsengisoli]
MKLYSYFRSSAAYRVRIALNLKGLSYETIPVHLLKEGGQQFSDSYRAVNPSQLVPTLVDNDVTVGQSIAILEYLEETHPQPPLLPTDAAGRARVRAIAQNIACDIHPLNNLRVLKYLKHELGQDDDARNGWYKHWIAVGLGAVEALLADHPDTGRFCHGDQPGYADACLVPQLFNARRMGCDTSAFPTIMRIDAACTELDAFCDAAPGSQPDSEG